MQKVSIDCNWKCSGEQSGGDGFHTLTLHRWLQEAGLLTEDAAGTWNAQSQAIDSYSYCYYLDPLCGTTYCEPKHACIKLTTSSGTDMSGILKLAEVLPHSQLTSLRSAKTALEH